jgi:hypothetical protein
MPLLLVHIHGKAQAALLGFFHYWTEYKLAQGVAASDGLSNYHPESGIAPC